MDLKVIREEIDKIDNEMVRLFQERMKRTLEVAAFKIENGKAVYDKEREDAKLDAVADLVADPFTKQAVRELFFQIMTISRKKQYTLVDNQTVDCGGFVPMEEMAAGMKKVACFGERGSYTEEAMDTYFSNQVEAVYKSTFQGVIEALENGEVEYGVLPIENSSTGSISDIYDLLVKSNTAIIGEQEVKVDQALIGMAGTDLSKVTKVYSHEQGILQCKTFLSRYPNMKCITFDSTSASVKKIAEEKDATQVAIGSVRAAKVYGLEVLQEKINGQSNNTTRFIVVTNKRVYNPKGKKVSLCFEVQHESGSLYQILSHFAYNHLNLTQIESRPIENKKWEYRFFVEFDGNILDAGVQNALRGIRQEASAVYLFGCFAAK